MNEDPDRQAPRSELEEARQLLSSTAISALAEDRWQKWRTAAAGLRVGGRGPVLAHRPTHSPGAAAR